MGSITVSKPSLAVISTTHKIILCLCVVFFSRSAHGRRDSVLTVHSAIQEDRF